MHDLQRPSRLLPHVHGIPPWPLLVMGGLAAFALLAFMLAFPAAASFTAGCATSVGAVAAVLALLAGIRIKHPATDQDDAHPRMSAEGWSIRTTSETMTVVTVYRAGRRVTARSIIRMESASSVLFQG